MPDPIIVEREKIVLIKVPVEGKQGPPGTLPDGFTLDLNSPQPGDLLTFDGTDWVNVSTIDGGNF